MDATRRRLGRRYSELCQIALVYRGLVASCLGDNELKVLEILGQAGLIRVDDDGFVRLTEDSK